MEVAMNPAPGKSPVAYVHPSKYVDYKLEPDLSTGNRCMEMLRSEGFNVKPNDKFEWIHDTYLILIRMFPKKCPPTTLISMNARFDPHFHMRVGSTLRPLRKEGYLIIGTGGAVHNLFRNKWDPMLKYRDNFAQETPPDNWALEFRQSVEDCVSNNRGPALRRAITRLMKHPLYRDAHATDDHFMAACFVAGAAGDWDDEQEERGRLGAETWELTNMCEYIEPDRLTILMPSKVTVNLLSDRGRKQGPQWLLIEMGSLHCTVALCRCYCRYDMCCSARCLFKAREECSFSS